LKEEQHALETKGLTKEQLKQKFDKQISEAKADWAKDKTNMEERRHHDK
jgi:hypothetical protein